MRSDIAATCPSEDWGDGLRSRRPASPSPDGADGTFIAAARISVGAERIESFSSSLLSRRTEAEEKESLLGPILESSSSGDHCSIITPNGEGVNTDSSVETPIGGKKETRPTHGTEHALEVAVVEQGRGVHAHARVVRHLGAPQSGTG